MEIPASLRRWFVAHFIVDLAFALPLLVAPGTTLGLFGFAGTDPVSPRLVGAALLAIGTQSFLGRHEDVNVYRAILNLKLIWSGSAIFGLLLGIGAGAPPAAWAILAIFITFFGVWTHYRLRIKQWTRALREGFE
jgi:hypothetical protein